MEYFSVLVSWGFNALIVDIILENFIENAALSYIVSFLIVGFLASLFLTPLGIILLRIQNNLLLPNEAESRRVDPIFDTVYKRAKEKTPSLPDNIRWFVIVNDQPNAAALGQHIVAVTTGLLAVCTDDEIAAVFGHEFGHIAHWDVVRSVLMVEGNVIFMVFKICFLLLLQLIFSLTSWLFSSINGTDIISRFFKFIGKLLVWLGNIYLSAIYYLALIPSFHACLKQEYAADLYSAELGFCDPLANFLSRCSSPKIDLKMSLAHMFYGIHPNTESRIERLKAPATTN